MSRIKELQKQVHRILEKMDDNDKRAKAIAHLHGVSLAALISGASQDVSIQYIASYNVVFPLYVVVRGPAKHCVLYDMKRICSAYEAKFSQPEKLT